MTADEYRAEIPALLRKCPRPEAIATVQSARNFKELCKKAGRLGGKSLTQLQTIFNQLKGYY
jgi:hypothetical protein